MVASTIYLNLAVRDLARSQAFFEQLGFSIDSRFSGEDSASVVLGEGIVAMLHTPETHARFDQRPLADAEGEATGIFAIGVDDRAEVDAIADRVVDAGGRIARDPEDHGFMYLRSFYDPDGRMWEVAWMDPATAEGDWPDIGTGS